MYNTASLLLKIIMVITLFVSIVARFLFKINVWFSFKFSFEYINLIVKKL